MGKVFQQLTLEEREQITWMEDKLNNTPRKCLGWQTPNEVFSQTVKYYKFQNYLYLKSSGAFRS
jgi:IS30 family transposase